ncbi:MAG: phage tail sheath family protein, partial [Chloroflexota bacterium]|nr:phage tail sheath family protein [Chloroflexota bacterium]
MRREWRSYSRDPYPDVQVHQIPSGVRAITGVATSITAFVGRTRRGPVNTATTVHGFADYERIFGGLWPDSTASFAIRDFFTGGGERAVVVRLVRHAGRASWDINDLLLEAVDEGSWANTVEVTLTQLDAAVDDAFAGRLGVTRADLFNLVVRDPVTGESEVHSNVTVLA